MSDASCRGRVRQLHVVASADINSGGEGLAALRYAQAVGQAGGAVTLLSGGQHGAQTGRSMDDGGFEQKQLPVGSNLLWTLCAQYSFIRTLCEQKQFDLIHLHGIWPPLLAMTAWIARRQGIALVISPHGCLEPWALNYKSLKKNAALKTYVGAVLRSTSLFVATAQQELESIRRLNQRQPVAVIPNGVDVGELPSRKSAQVKTFLFLSRVHPVKGLLDLVEAWALVRRPGWRFVIAGGDEEGYRAKVEALIREKGLEGDFDFLGFVSGAEKDACFEQADVFVLPTYSENFGIAVAEALANELPVITTTGAPWRDLLDYQCGWWVEPGVSGVAEGLRAAMECTSTQLREMGARGRQLVIEKYSWARIGVSALEVSNWVLNRERPKPREVSC